MKVQHGIIAMRASKYQQVFEKIPVSFKSSQYH